MSKVFAGLLAALTMLFLGWLFWPKKLSPADPQPREDISTVSFSEKRLEILSTRQPAPKSKSLPENISSALTTGRNFEVPNDAILPAILMDSGSSEKNEIADGLLISLEEDFFKDLEEAKSKGVAPQEIWEELRSKYDEKYIALFGQEAYLEATNLAADEAREDFQHPATPR